MSESGKMRVLHVITDLDVGGAEMMLVKLLRETAGETESMVISLMPRGNLSEAVEQLGVPLRSLRLRQGRLPGLATIRALLREAAAFAPDVIQGWMYHGNLAASLTALYAPGKPRLFWNVRQTLYDLNHEKLLTQCVIRASMMFVGRVQGIIYNSMTSALQHEALGYPIGRRQIVPNGFDLDAYRPNAEARHAVRQEFGVADSTLLVVSVARFHPMKDHLGLIAAIKQTVDAFENVHYLLVGKNITQKNETISRAIQSQGLESRVTLAGERADVPNILAAADLLVSSSAWGEAFPNVIGEAMASGVPCIATDIGDSAQVIGGFGRLVPPSKPGELAAAILDMLRLESNERLKLGLGARERVRALYAIPAVTRRYLEIYRHAPSAEVDERAAPPIAVASPMPVPLELLVPTAKASSSAPEVAKRSAFAAMRESLTSNVVRGGSIVLLSATLFAFALWLAGVDSVVDGIASFSVWTIAAVFAVLFLNLILVSVRLDRLLAYFGINLPFRVVSKASVQGHFAALFLFSIFGQIAGRQVVLRHYAVPSIVVGTLTVVERAILTVVSGGLCLLGAAHLLERSEAAAVFDKSSILQVLLVASLSLAASLMLGRSRVYLRRLVQLTSAADLGKLFEAVIVTVLAQSCILSAFVIVGSSLAPQASFMDLLAAAAITSFAASLPISVNGWGVRELAAVFAFGHIGMPDASALSMSILVGLGSTAVVLAAYPISLGKRSPPRKPEDGGPFSPSAAHKERIEKVGAWAIGLAGAVLVFFQFHIPFQSGEINLNLGDAAAVVALATVVMHCLSAREMPSWRVPGANLALGAVVSCFLIAFAIGVDKIGVTQWAFLARVLGWLVLLGYLSIGLLLATYLGRQGTLRIVDALMATAAVVVVSKVVIYTIAGLGWIEQIVKDTNFEGFANNRNAFALQMLVCLAMTLGYSSYIERLMQKFGNDRPNLLGRGTVFMLLQSTILAGVALSGSRAGLVAGASMLVFAALSRMVRLQRILVLIASSAAIWFFFVWALPMLAGSSSIADPSVSVQSAWSSDVSNVERWQSIEVGLQMWLENPIFGAGLGVFMAQSVDLFGRPLVIHSTPIWILAEFGLFGAVVMSSAFGWILLFLYRSDLSTPQSRAVVMVLVAFAVFGLAHEIFFQRIFWLVLGIGLAMPFRRQQIQ
jgi:glycosyltransferase involved in cell wall biosynthesis/uncharacterized membrane protein YbhN (UPF0104 family)